MTIKELSRLLEVSKPTVSRAIKDLGVEPIRVGNRYELDYTNAKRIANYIHPERPFSETQQTPQTENIATNSQKLEQSQQENASNRNNIEDRLLEMLQEELKEKDRLIHSQQEQIDILIKSNAILTAKLEDKSQKPILSDIAEELPQEKRETIWKRIKSFFGGQA